MNKLSIDRYIDNLLSNLTKNSTTKLVLVLIVHNVSLFLSILYLITSPVNNTYYMIVLLFIFVFIINYLDNGCPLLKLERKYLRSKEWFGGYHGLELINIIPSSRNIDNLFKGWTLFIVFIVTIKLIHNNFP